METTMNPTARPDSAANSAAATNPGIDLFTPADWERLARELKLTPREFSVAMLIFEGRTRYQIARTLGCAAGTVRVYIDRLFAKLNVRDRVGLVLRLVSVHFQMRKHPATPNDSHESATCDRENDD
jgi:DNA-binding NarL/FixJ family response regulator